MTSDDAPTRRSDSPALPSPGILSNGQRVFSRYVLEAEAGRGGMGVVWRAKDDELGGTVALKFLPEVVAHDATALDNLKTETRNARMLTHTNIVHIYDFERDDDLAAVAMEFVEGKTLSDLRLEQQGKVFSIQKLAPIVTQLCAAIEYAHSSAHVVHRDLKPANVIVTGAGLVKVTDFGIAHTLAETSKRLTGKSPDTSGTLPYMSPQQLLGEDASTADDIYALGATLYELLTGRPPFYTGDLAMQIRETLPHPLNDQRKIAGAPPVTDIWQQTIHACLAKKVSQRPKSARDIAARLGLGGGGSLVVPSQGQRPFLFAGGAILMIFALIVAFYALASRSTKPSSVPFRSPGPSVASSPQTTPPPAAAFVHPEEVKQVAPPPFIPLNGLGLKLIAIGSGRWMSATLVKVSDFAKFAKATGFGTSPRVVSVTPNGWEEINGSWQAPGFVQGNDHPVVGISWIEATAFCDWLTRTEQVAGRISIGQVYRLPRENEWALLP